MLLPFLHMTTSLKPHMQESSPGKQALNANIKRLSQSASAVHRRELRSTRTNNAPFKQAEVNKGVNPPVAESKLPDKPVLDPDDLSEGPAPREDCVYGAGDKKPLPDYKMYFDGTYTMQLEMTETKSVRTIGYGCILCCKRLFSQQLRLGISACVLI